MSIDELIESAKSDEEHRIDELEVALAKLQLRIKGLEECVNQADAALAFFQRTSLPQDDARLTCGWAIYVNQARNALTKAKEVTTLW